MRAVLTKDRFREQQPVSAGHTSTYILVHQLVQCYVLHGTLPGIDPAFASNRSFSTATMQGSFGALGVLLLLSLSTESSSCGISAGGTIASVGTCLQPSSSAVQHDLLVAYRQQNPPNYSDSVLYSRSVRCRD